MKTPKDYEKTIAAGVVTEKILSEVLYSINKRAKNYRDAKRRYSNSKYESNYEKALEKEQKFYSMKDDILSYLKPVKIHKEEKIKDYYIKYYDYEVEYDMIDDYVRTGGYFDRESQEYVDFKVVRETEIIELYFLLYELGEYTFHIPIEAKSVEGYELPVEVITDFITEGKDVNELLSSQFCSKVHKGLIEGTIKII